MNWRLILAALWGLMAGSLSHPAFSETRVSGAVSGLWERQGSPFIVTGDISLRNNETLRIEPGVIVVFQGNFRFTINGRLTAEGTERDSIFIYGGGQPGSWRGLFFAGPGADLGHMSYCAIRFAFQGINLNDADPQIDHSSMSFCADAGVSFNRSLSKLLNCKIFRINGTGVKVGGSSRAIVRACSIATCQDNGIVVNEGANPTLDHNTIDGVSDHGIALSQAAPCSVLFNTIIQPGARGISISESNGAVVMRNVTDGATGPGIWAYRSAGVQLVNNTVLNGGSYGVQITTNVTGTVANCIIANNGLHGLILQGGNPSCDYNDLYGNRSGNYSGVEAGAHDLHIPPDLDGNYNPRAGNALIDAGDPFQPPDPDGTRAEIGAGFLNQNRPPEIRSFLPNWPQDTTVQGDRIYDFSADVVDPDRHFLTWKWFVNGVEEWRNVAYRRNFNRDGEYTVRLLVDDRYYLGQAEHIWHFFVDGSSVTSDGALPEGYFLSEVYPNPFNGILNFQLTVPRREKVNIDLLDWNGRRLKAISSGERDAGDHRITFDAGWLPSGEYVIRVDIGKITTLRRSILLR